MRLFIALSVPEDLRQALAQTQVAMRRKGVRGRFVPTENLHMTLVFLGNVPDPAPAIETLQGVTVPRAALRLDRLSLFGDVLVALYRQNKTLTAYVQTLRAALNTRGVPYDTQGFRPHITLCRKISFPTADFRLFPFERTLQTVRLPVKEVRLMASDLSGDAPKYTAIHTEKQESIL